eukprot:scpid63835/ scgid6449/ 
MNQLRIYSTVVCTLACEKHTDWEPDQKKGYFSTCVFLSPLDSASVQHSTVNSQLLLVVLVACIHTHARAFFSNHTCTHRQCHARAMPRTGNDKCTVWMLPCR